MKNNIMNTKTLKWWEAQQRPMLHEKEVICDADLEVIHVISFSVDS